MAKKKIVIGNWKMNPAKLSVARAIVDGVKKRCKNIKKTEIILCVPYVFISDLEKLVSRNKNISIGAQSAFWECEGSYTGKISPLMLIDLGVKYVIIGHSEERCLGETEEILNKKVNSLLQLGLKVVLCVGETERDETGEYLRFIRNQLIENLK